MNNVIDWSNILHVLLHMLYYQK